MADDASDFTLGIEEEYQLIKAETRGAITASPRIINRLRGSSSSSAATSMSACAIQRDAWRS